MKFWDRFKSYIGQTVNNFIPYKNENLEVLKTQLHSELKNIELPDELQCPLELDLPNNPVLTIWGHVFDDTEQLRQIIQNNSICPLSQNPLTEQDLRRFVKLTELFRYLRDEKQKITNEINQMSIQDEKNIREKLNKYQQIIAQKQAELLDILKSHLEDEIELSYFYCPILQGFPRVPVITKYGHLFDKESLSAWINRAQSCPLTRAELTKDDIYEYEDLTLFIEDVTGMMKDQSNLINKINKMTLEEKAKVFKNVVDFKKKSTDKNKELLALLISKKNDIVIQKQVQQEIQQIKIQLLIDIQNLEHLRFWQFQIKTKKGGKTILFNGQLFRVPTRVAKIFNTAGKQYRSVENFLYAINKARQNSIQLKLTSNPFSIFVRSETTKQLYNATNDEIKNLVLRQGAMR